MVWMSPPTHLGTLTSPRPPQFIPPRQTPNTRSAGDVQTPRDRAYVKRQRNVEQTPSQQENSGCDEEEDGDTPTPNQTRELEG